MFQLERIEWTITWCGETSLAEKARVFLIGDSISVGYRSIVQRELGGRYFVTAFSTSKALDNPWFNEELALTVKQNRFHYDIVHFNNGLHGWHLDDETYRQQYIQMIQSLKCIFPDSKLTLALTTNLCDKTEIGFSFRDGNERVLRRNEIVRELGKMFCLPVDDLYSVSVGNRHLHSEDGTHYTPDGYQVLGQAVAAFLQRQLL